MVTSLISEAAFSPTSAANSRLTEPKHVIYITVSHMVCLRSRWTVEHINVDLMNKYCKYVCHEIDLGFFEFEAFCWINNIILIFVELEKKVN